ncbi:hypothetical protein [Piscinibacter koreensis]|uniref:Uncharacterized protein n=1 Tax=Piscinibacter koreensis TaxID=2742824 RepID=A0A7Y6TWF2_9BURK|nr:hypothetical protein [Schlegelella koreensis]NUZ06064.1 hypothetical protein [Schlegelella koreensis]
MSVLDTGSDSSRVPLQPLRPAAPPDSAWSVLDEELVRAQRVANDNIERADLDWLCRGFSAFLASGGKLPLERCLRLPTNERALRRARRDHWLRLAWQEIDATVSSWRRSEMLAVEVHRFQIGKWLRWANFEQAPAGASALDSALFEAFRSHERVPSTAMQLHNIAGQRRSA